MPWKLPKLKTALVKTIKEKTKKPNRTIIMVFAFIFVCEPKSLALTNANNVPDDESTNPEWIEVSKLSAESFQVFGRKIMQIIERSK